MSTQKFEKLIEYVINDEEQKASELFHEIVVEKSREIYENLMADEFGGDEFAADVEADEEGFDEVGDEGDEFGGEDEFAGDEFGGEEASVEDLEDRVVDLEDKLDELMAEFDALMGDEEGTDEFGGEDEFAADDEFGGEDEFAADDEFGGEDEYREESFDPLAEEVKLTPVPKPSNVEGADNTKSPVVQNSGKKGVGSGGNPVKTDTGAENGRTAPSAKGMGVNDPQAAGKGAFKSKAPAAHTKGEPSGTNAKSVLKK
jgi:hypothetical protein